MTLRLNRDRGKSLGRHLPALFVFIAVYVLLTWPLALHPRSSVLGSVYGDGWKTVEQFWWYKHSTVDLGVSPLYDPDIFYPRGWYTATSSHSLTLMLPTVPLTIALGPIGAYNLTMLWSFLLAGLGAYTLVYRLTHDRLAGILSGISYAFCMSRLLRAAGHLNVSVGSAWIPWVFVCLELSRSSSSRRKQIFWAVLAGVTYACSMLSYWYFVYLVAIPLAAYFLYELWQSRQDRTRLGSVIRTGLITFLVAGVLVAPLMIVTLQARATAGVQPFAYEATTDFAASPDRFLLPNRYNPIWGDWIRINFGSATERDFVFLGLAATGLAFVAMLKHVHSRVKTYTVIAIVSLILAMGPQLLWNDSPVQIQLPGLGQSMSVPLPGALFYRYAPMFSVIRVWSRFSLVGSVAIAVLAGLALAYLHRQLRWGRLIAIGLILVVTLEAIGQPFSVVPASLMEREVDSWLTKQPDQFAIMELPLNDRLNGGLMYSHVLHGKQLALGYTAAIPGFFLNKVSTFSSFPNQQTVDVMQRWCVRYILYTSRDSVKFNDQIAPAIAALHNVSYVGDFGGYPGERVHVYEVSLDSGCNKSQ